MARKSIIEPIRILDNINMASNFTSMIIDTEMVDVVHIAVSWSGAGGGSNGSITVETSTPDFYDQTIQTAWTALDFGASITISGVTGSHLININQCPFSRIRVIFTSTAGSGNLLGELIAKSIGS